MKQNAEGSDIVVDEMIQVFSQLGDMEQKLVLSLAKRVALGQGQYGHLSLGKKAWKKEACEELVDACVYMWMAAEELKR